MKRGLQRRLRITAVIFVISFILLLQFWKDLLPVFKETFTSRFVCTIVDPVLAQKMSPVLPSKSRKSCEMEREYFDNERISNLVAENSLFGTCNDTYDSRDLSDFCNDAQSVMLVVFVITSPGNFERRRYIRETWGNQKYHGMHIVKVIFICGKSSSSSTSNRMSIEKDQYKDVLIADFLDTYESLTLKVATALQWIQENCKQAEFVLKIDDDVFVNIFILLKHLTEKVHFGHSKETLECGLFFLHSVGRRSKYGVSRSEYPYSHYPCYCSGPAYFMSQDIATKLSYASHYTPFFPMEDLYFTGILRVKMGISITGVQSHSQFKLSNFYNKPWTLQSKYYMFCHTPDFKSYTKFWDFLVKMNGKSESVIT